MKVRDAVIEFAATHHGYITTRDAHELGIDPAQLRLMAARDRLERVSRGVYRVPLLPRGRYDKFAQAVAWTLGRGVISHESALFLHGLADMNPLSIHLTVPRANYPRTAGGELYLLHRRDLDAGDTTDRYALPVTTVSRSICDCLRGVEADRLRTVVDQARVRNLIGDRDADVLRAVITAYGATHTTRRLS
ncbi:type IV toxin-antitoxin system AbiEi family antitoxin domain-containing protein [Rarobacter faecitabidus]|uniref:Putative AbiEi antitoxin of type IV toxin-antitoxin system n=1 Tax=Rarobacter faecitabidus TaxID=13243 RepID=A0A542ZUQ4_RARFA|nr:type IV toxin-antitoxin system AbiEi family antitoxin domain-containing protein [Rarobacter faecitabidus]TQL64103.1 putative AbiEi antitoxin of type IV toxin-antitoxin system [Rarobacter faecitabidus]